MAAAAGLASDGRRLCLKVCGMAAYGFANGRRLAWPRYYRSRQVEQLRCPSFDRGSAAALQSRKGGNNVAPNMAGIRKRRC